MAGKVRPLTKEDSTSGGWGHNLPSTLERLKGEEVLAVNVSLLLESRASLTATSVVTILPFRLAAMLVLLSVNCAALISRIFAMVTLPVTCSSRWENGRTRLWVEQQIACASSTAQQLGNIIAPTFLHAEFQF